MGRLSLGGAYHHDRSGNKVITRDSGIAQFAKGKGMEFFIDASSCRRRNSE